MFTKKSKIFYGTLNLLRFDLSKKLTYDVDFM